MRRRSRLGKNKLLDEAERLARKKAWHREYDKRRREKINNDPVLLSERQRKSKVYHEENKERAKEKADAYYSRNKERLLKKRVLYYKENKVVLDRAAREYYEENKDKFKLYNERHRDRIRVYKKIRYEKIKADPELLAANKESNRMSQKKRRKNSLTVVLSHRMSTGIYHSLKKGAKNHKHWEELVDFTLDDLIVRLKSTLPDNYSWEDFTKIGTELAIDHILPIDSFDFSNSEDPEFKQCWALSNLQILTRSENCSKSNKILPVSS